MDYLLRRGYSDTAELLALDESGAMTAGQPGLTDVEIILFKELKAIEKALQAGSAVEALAWCKDNASALKKSKVRMVGFGRMGSYDFDPVYPDFRQSGMEGKDH